MKQKALTIKQNILHAQDQHTSIVQAVKKIQSVLVKCPQKAQKITAKCFSLKKRCNTLTYVAIL